MYQGHGLSFHMFTSRVSAGQPSSSSMQLLNHKVHSAAMHVFTTILCEQGSFANCHGGCQASGTGWAIGQGDHAEGAMPCSSHHNRPHHNRPHHGKSSTPRSGLSGSCPEPALQRAVVFRHLGHCDNGPLSRTLVYRPRAQMQHSCMRLGLLGRRATTCHAACIGNSMQVCLQQHACSTWAILGQPLRPFITLPEARHCNAACPPIWQECRHDVPQAQPRSQAVAGARCAIE